MSSFDTSRRETAIFRPFGQRLGEVCRYRRLPANQFLITLRYAAEIQSQITV